MTLLIPELERQLRAVVRAHHAGARSQSRRGAGAGRLFLALGVVSAMAIAGLAVVLIGSREHALSGSPTTDGTLGTSRARLTCGLPPRLAPTPAGPFVAAASGTVDGHRWELQAKRDEQGAATIEHGQLVLDGRTYGFCSSAVQFHLIDTAPRGIVYGFIADHGHYTIDFGLVHGSGAQTVRRLAGGTFFLQVLPDSACNHRSLTMTASARDYSPSRGMTDTDVESFGACSPDQIVTELPGPIGTAVGQGVLPSQVPAGVSGATRRSFLEGRTVASDAGCAACHTIGTAGNSGPGRDLTNIGRLLDPRAIQKAIVNPHAPMPAYRLPSRELKALVTYLSELKGG